MPGKIRVFIAISLPGHVKKELKRLQDRLKSAGIQGSWPRPETLHLTLKFLGEVDEDRVPCLRECLGRTAGRACCFDLTAGGLGVFPGVSNPRIIWAGTGGRTDILDMVFRDLEQELYLLGFQREPRRFLAHVTLARMKKDLFLEKDLAQLIRACRDIRSRTFTVRSLELYKSRLRPEGPVHSVLFSARFGGKCESLKNY